MMTFKELKKLVKLPLYKEQRVPTVKALEESGVSVVAEKILENHGSISVYQNGYVIYRAHKRVTVFSLRNCVHYKYDALEGAGHHIEEEEFEEYEWHIRLVLEGEDRIFMNYEIIQGKWMPSREDREYREEILEGVDEAVSTLERMISEERVEELLSTLTDLQRKVVHTHLFHGLSFTEAAKHLGMTRQNLTGIYNAAIYKITNAELERILFPDKYQKISTYVEPDYPYIHRELAKPGVTLTLLWEEYCRKCYESGRTPYMSTQFGDKYRKWARITKATMRIQHKPGDAIQVDWAGDTVPVYDSVTGAQSAAYLFVAVLPCSCYVYAEACDDMKTENWLNCHVHAFNYFGGVARLLVPDNCKTATVSNTRYETVLNRSYQELAEYYGTAIVPARVRKPQDKSAAEASVRLVETWIIAALRDMKFFSLRELNEAVAEKLEELNNRKFKQHIGTRRSAYLEEEQAYMLPLPAAPFEAAVWSAAKVPNDYLVSDGRNKYSVPYNLIGEKVDIRVTKTIVEVYFHGSRVASHRRLQTKQREPLMKLEHMPQEHQRYLAYNAEDFKTWAMSVGPMTEKAVYHFLDSGKAPEQGYKACASLKKLGDRYGRKRLENACGRVLAFTTTPSVRNISSLLKNEKALPDLPQPEQPKNINRYGITRGASYFKKGGEQE